MALVVPTALTTGAISYALSCVGSFLKPQEGERESAATTIKGCRLMFEGAQMAVDAIANAYKHRELSPIAETGEILALNLCVAYRTANGDSPFKPVLNNLTITGQDEETLDEDDFEKICQN